MLSVIVSKMNQLAAIHAGRAMLGAVAGVYSTPSPPEGCLLSHAGSQTGSRPFSSASISAAKGYFLLSSHAGGMQGEEGALKQVSAPGSDTLKTTLFLEYINASKSAFLKLQYPSWKSC